MTQINKLSWSYQSPNRILSAGAQTSPKGETEMLTIGEKFPAFKQTAGVSLEKGKEFEVVSNEDHPDKWKVVFFWPKDFTFVCPTEIAAFGKKNRDFLDRDAQVLGVSNENGFVHVA